MWKTGPLWSVSQNIYVPTGRGWPRLEATTSLIWRGRGVLKGALARASGGLFST